ncbi:HNH endonuclease [Arthrobacter sp. Sa2CUA1]|uniref:HNH endonuclease n=1 Tax=Arthrobacter gallicola TaxID=2762225 RepID=A0ABR8UVR7_9MICC|nr:HNH endonuclease [Arthrobacter gallicola]MBD7996618.1 HNH endonuclease [Arthrobacter gallicola]
MEQPVTAVLLGWDPVWPEAWQPDYSEAAAGAQDAGFFRVVWDVSANPEIEPGSDTWFVLPGEAAGVAGHGVVVSFPYHIADAGEGTLFTVADVDIDMLLPLGEQIPLPALLPDLPADALEGDGGIAVLDGRAGNALRAAWARQVAGVPGRAVSPVPGTLPQQALRWSLASRWENDPDAARMCLVHHGPACAACGFDFAAAFGSGGAQLMQVHHIVPPRLVDETYALDPAVDLVPLCPNCHAMAHAGSPDPYTPAELRRLLEAQRSPAAAQAVDGILLSPEAVQAQADAARLLRTRTPRPD